ncbi:MAG: nucleotidyltransferase domain-containing protein [Candidatus Pacearchaeota archaeon]|nr:nucleotidyltransferase domain-containing protein [Candidatus Pacearchaeota archaeon]
MANKTEVPKPPKNIVKKFPTLKLTDEYEIAYNFAIKVYEKFGKLIKSIILFGSAAKKKAVKGSDIDIVIILDDCTVQWDQELVAWYREELGKIIRQNPYVRPLHVNTVRLSTWWNELLRGEPVIINIIRYGQALIDFGGFFNPLKVLLAQGKIKSTPEAIYIMLQRAPTHLLRTKASLLNSIEGMYWAFVDASHAALIAAKKLPPSPEHIGEMLREVFVSKGMLDNKYVLWYEEIYKLAHDILHGHKLEVKAREIEEWLKRTDLFLQEMAKLVNKII